MSETALPSLDVRYRESAPLVTDRGIEIYHETNGDTGPNVVLLNNFYSIAPMWRTWAPTLSQDYRVTTYDLRNQGATTAGFEAVSWSDHLDDLRDLLDGLGLEQVYLVGTSTSTLLARDFAIAHPDRVEGVVLQAPSFSPYTSRRRRAVTRSWLNTLESAGTPALWDQLYSQIFSDQTMAAGGNALYLGLREVFTSLHSVASLLANLTSSLEAADDPDSLSTLVCPTLLIIGENDFLWSRSSAEAAAQLIPDSELLFLPNIGHLLSMEATEAVEQGIRTFIGGLESAKQQ
ncbi:alpha/beta fold hydrolase [Nocardia sp. NPDC051052]|uniref:alpha/beta fold hydrolase n=1 Tax=Nocardia sp. NPDC051052 TaxID=3364322 RepID=UPI0037B4870A